MNKTLNDVFLNKLCPKEQPTPDTPPQEDPSHEDPFDQMDEHDPIHEEVTTFNENVHWKKQKPVLGMRFENPKQLKHMLCNYVVAKGYQLCYKKMIVGGFQLNVVQGNASLDCGLHG